MVHNDALQRAIKGLSVHDVYLKKSECFTKDGWDPKRPDDRELVYQFMTALEKSEVFGVAEVSDSSSNDETKNFFSVYIKVGCRLVADKDVDTADNIFAQIEASFVAEYVLRPDFSSDDEDALTTFAIENASFHVWPYWREYLMATCTRLNLPKVALPVRQFTSKE
ncbi:MAG: preprotein translocase subunit SecB [Alkalimonas sp.]|nr:preprotein translocase subunit SecB [Alkalimonas sp.]